MKKAMLSQPMAGKSEAEIIATREQVIRVFKERGYEVVNTLFTDEWWPMDWKSSMRRTTNEHSTGQTGVNACTSARHGRRA